MKRIAMLLLVATGLATVASAANWMNLGESNDGKKTLYLDLDSVQRKGEFASLWMKLADENGEYTLYRDQLRSDTRQYRVLHYIHYSQAGNPLDTGDWGESALWRDIPPGALVEIVYEALFKR